MEWRAAMGTILEGLGSKRAQRLGASGMGRNGDFPGISLGVRPSSALGPDCSSISPFVVRIIGCKPVSAVPVPL